MLNLTEILRQSDPLLQVMIRAVEEAPKLPQMVLAAWQLARMVAR